MKRQRQRHGDGVFVVIVAIVAAVAAIVGTIRWMATQQDPATDISMMMKVAPNRPIPPASDLMIGPPVPAPLPVNCAVANCVALTFDDGPGPETSRLLDILADKNVHATFFLVGYMIAHYSGDVARMRAEGHVVGNHSYNHPHFRGKSADWIADQLRRTNEAIIAAGGPPPALLRPPYGEQSPDVTQAAKSLGMTQVLWSVDPLDWKDRDTPTVVQRVVSEAKAGSIVLMHDIRPTTVDAVAQIIDGLRAAGYELVTVPQLVGTSVPGSVVRQGPRVH